MSAAARFVLALDQGTTSSRAAPVRRQRPHRCAGAAGIHAASSRSPGWVEHDASEIWATQLDHRTRRCARRRPRPATSSRSASPISARRRCSGIAPPASPSRPPSSGRTGAPPTPASSCAPPGSSEEISARTGLLLDPYFSGTKLAWLLDTRPGRTPRAECGELAFGTMDSWLLFKLTGHRRHVTDATNASRTLLSTSRRATGTTDCSHLLRVPRACLPQSCDPASTRTDAFGDRSGRHQTTGDRDCR